MGVTVSAVVFPDGFRTLKSELDAVVRSST
jgi:hypothetical protein